MPALGRAATIPLRMGVGTDAFQNCCLPRSSRAALWAGSVHAAEPDPAQVAQARAAVKELGEVLKSQLMAAIKARGPIAALGVCKTVAPALAEKTGAARGLKIGRTALRVRNPANAPDAWERGVLEDFAAKIKAGADPAQARARRDGDGRRSARARFAT